MSTTTQASPQTEMMYTVTTEKGYRDAVAAVEKETAAHGFTVLTVHDVAATLAKKNHAIEPLSIVEICNAKHAKAVLQSDIAISLMLPCRISVYEQAGRVYISTLRPTLLASFFPGAKAEETAAEVDRVIRTIIDAAK